MQSTEDARCACSKVLTKLEVCNRPAAIAMSSAAVRREKKDNARSSHDAHKILAILVLLARTTDARL